MCNTHNIEEPGNYLRRLLRPIVQSMFSWQQVWFYRGFIKLSKRSETPVIGNFVKFLGNFLAKYYSGTVVPMDEAINAIKHGNCFVVADCACREIAGKHPERCCIYVGKAAKVWEKVSKLNAKKVTKKEAVDIVKRKHKEGCITTMWSCTSKEVYGICNCCRCCCLAIKFNLDCNIAKALHMPPFAAEVLHEVEETEKKCSGCGACVRVCSEFFGARKMVNGKVVIDKDKCMACGRCLQVCPHTKIKTYRKPGAVYSDYKYRKR